MQFPITIGLRRSRLLDTAVLLNALLASGLLWAIPRTLEVQVATLLAVWLTAGLSWHQLIPKISAVRLARGGEISLALNGEHDFLGATLQPNGVVHAWLTVVRLVTDDGSRCTLIATIDNLDRQDFRRLRSFLRWQAKLNGADDVA